VGVRIFTFFILMIGLGVVALPAGLFADALKDAPDTE
jgi:voltage-gated potassium channel